MDFVTAPRLHMTDFRRAQICSFLGAVGGGIVAVIYAFTGKLFQSGAYGFIGAMFLCVFAAITSYDQGRSVGYDFGYIDAERDAGGATERRLRQETESRRPCEIITDGQLPADGEGFIYALKLSTGVVKVGQTLDLVRRTREHRRDAGAFGAAIVDYWFSPAHQNYLENEVELIVMCDEAATWRSKREYFQGVEFAEVVKFACSLTYYSDNAIPAEEVNA